MISEWIIKKYDRELIREKNFEQAKERLLKLADKWLSEQPFGECLQVALRESHEVSSNELTWLNIGVEAKKETSAGKKEVRKSIEEFYRNGACPYVLERSVSVEVKEWFSTTLETMNYYIHQRFGSPSSSNGLPEQVINIQKVDGGYLLFYWE